MRNNILKIQLDPKLCSSSSVVRYRQDESVDSYGDSGRILHEINLDRRSQSSQKSGRKTPQSRRSSRSSHNSRSPQIHSPEDDHTRRRLYQTNSTITPPTMPSSTKPRRRSSEDTLSLVAEGSAKKKKKGDINKDLENLLKKALQERIWPCCCFVSSKEQAKKMAKKTLLFTRTLENLAKLLVLTPKY